MVSRSSMIWLPCCCVGESYVFNASRTAGGSDGFIVSGPGAVSGDLQLTIKEKTDGGRVLFLGWSYKAGVGDARETPAESLAANLIEGGISVSTWDPYLEANDIPDSIEVIDDISNAERFDMVVLVTAHKECIEIDWSALLERMRTAILYDGRRVLDLAEMRNMGWKANAVGSPIQH